MLDNLVSLYYFGNQKNEISFQRNDGGSKENNRTD